LVSVAPPVVLIIAEQVLAPEIAADIKDKVSEVALEGNTTILGEVPPEPLSEIIVKDGAALFFVLKK